MVVNAAGKKFYQKSDQFGQKTEEMSLSYTTNVTFTNFISFFPGVIGSLVIVMKNNFKFIRGGKVRIYLIALVVFLSCAPAQVRTIPVNVYNLTSSEVLHGEFYWTGLKGKVKLLKDNGEACEGEYLTQMHGYTATGSSTGWGNIYHWGFMGGGAFAGTSTKVKILPNTNVGSAILVSRSGMVETPRL